MELAHARLLEQDVIKKDQLTQALRTNEKMLRETNGSLDRRLREREGQLDAERKRKDEIEAATVRLKADVAAAGQNVTGLKKQLSESIDKIGKAESVQRRGEEKYLEAKRQCDRLKLRAATSDSGSGLEKELDTLVKSKSYCRFAAFYPVAFCCRCSCLL